MSDLDSDSTKKDTKPTVPHNQPTAGKIFFKATLLSLLFAGVMLFITALGVSGFAYYKLHKITQAAETSIPELYSLVKTGVNSQPSQTDGYKTILLLGLDSVANKPGSPLLTDTIMLISIHLESGSIKTISLPRDLWSADYLTRINALYHYGQEKYPDSPQQFPEEVISEMTGIPIEHTIILSLEQVSQIIDMIGGINIDVPEGFTDTEFPREDVDIHTANYDDLYETVTFKKGSQNMDGETVLKYIRSRKSVDLSQGTDVARSNRQQQVISALLLKMQNYSVLKNTTTLSNLYKYYNANFETQLSKKEVISTLYSLFPLRDSISYSSNTLSIYPENEFGVITNPPVYKYNGEWVYEIRDLQSFQEEVTQNLRGENTDDL